MLTTMKRNTLFLVAVTVIILFTETFSFQQPGESKRTVYSNSPCCPIPSCFSFVSKSHATTTRKSYTALLDRKPEFSQDLMLREEAEAPFRKVRFFFYASLGAGALVSLLVSATRIAAALSGINEDLLQESSINAAVDAAGLVVLGLLWQNDSKSQLSRLKRASKGAELAKLNVRVSKYLMEEASETTDASTFTTSLASLRRGRGIEKRVVIAAAGREKMTSVVNEAKDLAESLILNDLLVVPVVLPSVSPPAEMLDANDFPECLALPVGTSWSIVVEDEVQQATEQGIDVVNEGLCVILKKNGRVGQRTRGIFLSNMVGEVTRRRDAGLDVINI